MSATMVACNRVGIQVFVTGGIGGVHRGGESSELLLGSSLCDKLRKVFALSLAPNIIYGALWLAPNIGSGPHLETAFFYSHLI